jgi:hypothetical protein
VIYEQESGDENARTRAWCRGTVDDMQRAASGVPKAMRTIRPAGRDKEEDAHIRTPDERYRCGHDRDGDRTAR